jgi:hypothetical protein
MSGEPTPEAQYSGKYRLRSLEEILEPHAAPETWRWQMEEMEAIIQRLEADRRPKID